LGNFAEMSGPLESGRGWPFGAPWAGEVEAHHYVMEEFRARGSARSYVLPPDAVAGPDGRWQTVVGPAADYVTRFYVVRPASQSDFNGTVVFNWQNVTAGVDAGVPGGREIWRGYAWVGVTTQRIGVEGTGSTEGLCRWDPERYGGLRHPGDEWSYGIFTQVARAVVEHRSMGADPLGGFSVSRVLATGASQSATRLASYYNGVHQHEGLFDGFLLQVFYGAMVPPGEGRVPITPEGHVLGNSCLRDDLATPVLVINSENEAWSIFPLRQPDTDVYRFWEVNGGSHSGGMGADIMGILERDGVAFRTAGAPALETPNSLDWSYAADAGLRALALWTGQGVPPPRFEPLTMEERLPHDSVVRDELGVARGGLRLPDVEVPLGVQWGANRRAGEPRRLSGEWQPFDAQTLAALYPDALTFLARWDQAVERLIAAGGAVAEDSEQLRRRGRVLADEAGITSG
jgi:Alpha/beta hydrolase domain